MYKGYNLTVDSSFKNEYYQFGLESIKSIKDEVETKIKSFSNKDGSLNGTAMTESWFPTFKCDVFISHSHGDEKLAISIAGWLYHEFNLTSFIDSCAWGYADKLIKLIDDEFCVIKPYHPDKISYDYNLRNLSTSHVHMMLTTALSSMIDNSECLFFLNTPNSIFPNDVVKLKSTLSPWIYSEIAISKLIRTKDLTEHRGLPKIAKSIFEKMEKLLITHDIDLSHLEELNVEDLLNWERTFKSNSLFRQLAGHDIKKALDYLY
ncbi:MAG: hypothetical protein J0L62_15310 [Bacteroidetes bacterium]|nr:hypothetical protein [Bacteroidota bacterium]